MTTKPTRIIVRRLLAITLPCVLWPAISFGADSPDQPLQAQTSLLVTYDMYYGKRNPTCRIIDSIEVRNLLKLFIAATDSAATETLAANDAKRLYPDHPGYRGLIIDVAGEAAADVPRHFFVYKGTIMRVKGQKLHMPHSERLAPGGTVTARAAQQMDEAGKFGVYCMDKGNAIEKMLMQKALDRGIVKRGRDGKIEQHIDRLIAQ
jgi:hypothetical protein